jgi:hypothetical protein
VGRLLYMVRQKSSLRPLIIEKYISYIKGVLIITLKDLEEGLID